MITEHTAPLADATHVGLTVAHLLVILVLLGLLALFVGTLVSIVRSELSWGMKLVWVALAFVAPVLGTALWLLIGRRDAQRRAFG
jgi:hypothetical protein